MNRFRAQSGELREKIASPSQHIASNRFIIALPSHQKSDRGSWKSLDLHECQPEARFEGFDLIIACQAEGTYEDQTGSRLGIVKTSAMMNRWQSDKMGDGGAMIRRVRSSVISICPLNLDLLLWVLCILNIAEGNAKFSESERRRFFRIARASTAEVGACLDLMRSFGLTSPVEATSFKSRLEGISKMLWALMR